MVISDVTAHYNKNQRGKRKWQFASAVLWEVVPTSHPIKLFTAGKVDRVVVGKDKQAVDGMEIIV